MSEGANATWGAADQVVSGLSNVLLPIAVARVASQSQLGAVSASMVALAALLAVSRAGLGTRIVLAATRSGGGAGVEESRATSLVVIGAPAIVAFVLLIGGVAGGWEAMGAVAIVALAAPFVLLQDLLRFTCSAQLNSRLAFVSDSLWACGTGLALILLGVTATDGELGVLMAAGLWFLGSLGALSVLVVILRWRPRFSGLRRWVRRNSSYLAHSAGGTASVSAANVARIAGIGALVGPQAVGALAAGQLLMTPLNLLVSLIPFVAMPLIARRESSPRVVKNAYLGTALLVLCSSVAWWVVCALTSDEVGRVLLGDAWASAERLLTPMALMSMGILLMAAATSLLLAIGEARLYSISMIGVALSSMAAALAVSLSGHGVEALAWAQAGVVWLGVFATWIFALSTKGSIQREGAIDRQ